MLIPLCPFSIFLTEQALISLLSLTKLAMALDMADELRELFTQVPYRNIQEVIDERKRNTTSFI